jgi:hypothetical protein
MVSAIEKFETTPYEVECVGCGVLILYPNIYCKDCEMDNYRDSLIDIRLTIEAGRSIHVRRLG